MKVLPFKIPKPEEDALIYQVDFGNSFYDKLHQHKEIQISFIVEGEGTLVVGDSINKFTENDVLVIGSHLPHVFKSYDKGSDSSHMISLFFTKESFGVDFFNLIELKALQAFFKRAKHGFKILSHHKKLKDLFFQLENESKFNRFLILLQILKITAKSQGTTLSSFIYDKTYSDNEGERMRAIFEYTMTNYREEITLSQVANVANMTKNAFCKYFKKRTNKTYIQFLNELRIEHASRLLQTKNDQSITEIAEQAGFNNMSHFNRQFKALKDCSPSEFKKILY